MKTGRIERGGFYETSRIHNSAYYGGFDRCEINVGEERRNNKVFSELSGNDKR